MSLNLRINVLEKFKKCPGMSLNVLEFDFENPVATMLYQIIHASGLVSSVCVVCLGTAVVLSSSCCQCQSVKRISMKNSLICCF